MSETLGSPEPMPSIGKRLEEMEALLLKEQVAQLTTDLEMSVAREVSLRAQIASLQAELDRLRHQVVVGDVAPSPVYPSGPGIYQPLNPGGTGVGQWQWSNISIASGGSTC